MGQNSKAGRFRAVRRLSGSLSLLFAAHWQVFPDDARQGNERGQA